MILEGHVLDRLRELPDNSIDCVVTSPPYWGLRAYGTEPQVWGGKPKCRHRWGDALPGSTRGGNGAPSTKNGRGEGYGRSEAKGCFCTKRGCGAWKGELGLEPTPELFVERTVIVFREIRRVLKKSGTCWVNIGDCYATGADSVGDCPGGGARGETWPGLKTSPNRMRIPGLKAKDLVMIPFRLALALQADGWWVRQDCIWSKPNPMPESVQDRFTKAHEYVFLLTKSKRYFWNKEGASEPVAAATGSRLHQNVADQEGSRRANGGAKTNGPMRAVGTCAGRNKRSVWEIPTQPYSEDHYAAYPEELVKTCLMAGCPPDGTVLDPFGGRGTTGVVAKGLGLDFILIELQPAYVRLIEKNIANAQAPLEGVA